jgi:hypothetical protein
MAVTPRYLLKTSPQPNKLSLRRANIPSHPMRVLAYRETSLIL